MSLERSVGLAQVSWSEGPLALWRAGISVMNVWQRVWFDNLSRTQGLFSVWPAGEKALAPWSDLLGRLGQPRPVATAAPRRVEPVKPAAAPAPAPVVAAMPNERQEIEAAVAAKQGRATPKLGCLEGVEVVGGPAPAALAEPAPAEAPAAQAADSVTSMLAMQAKSLAKAVRPRRAAAEGDAKPMRKAAKPVAPVAVGKAPVAAAKAVKKVAKPSVRRGS